MISTIIRRGRPCMADACVRGTIASDSHTDNRSRIPQQRRAVRGSTRRSPGTAPACHAIAPRGKFQGRRSNTRARSVMTPRAGTHDRPAMIVLPHIRQQAAVLSLGVDVEEDCCANGWMMRGGALGPAELDQMRRRCASSAQRCDNKEAQLRREGLRAQSAGFLKGSMEPDGLKNPMSTWPQAGKGNVDFAGLVVGTIKRI